MHLTPAVASVEGVTVLAQNSDPFTYFGEPAGPGLRATSRSTTARSRSPCCAVPPSATWAAIIARVLADRFEPQTTARSTTSRRHRGAIESLSPDSSGDPRRFPVQVDGDYIGDHAELELASSPARSPSLPDGLCLLPDRRAAISTPIVFEDETRSLPR